MLKEIPEEYIKQFEPAMKVGLLATVTSDELPHITLIATIQANNPKQVIWGQFIEGISKHNVKKNPKTAFLIMTLNKELWRGKALWTHECKEGPEYIMYNNKPLYRYNSYFGIHTVHFMDLVEISEKSKLNMGAIAVGAIKTKLLKSTVKAEGRGQILKPWAEGLFNTIGALKFLSYIGGDGFPEIIPVIQAQASDSTRIAFSISPYSEELKKLTPGKEVSILGLTLDMEDVLIKGRFQGFQRTIGGSLGIVDIDQVYNSMPPKHGYVYPEEKLEAVTEF